MSNFTGVGRLVADPELRQVPTGDKETAVTSFRMAFNEYRKVGDETKRNAHFFDFVAWDTGAKTICERSKKGDQLYVECTPRQETWEDKDTGQKRSKVVFRVNRFQVFNRNQPETETKPEEKSEFSDSASF